MTQAPTAQPAPDTATGEVRMTSSSGASKGSKPERMDLIPVDALRALARVYGFGGGKYEPVLNPETGRLVDNWTLGYPFHLSYAAAMRHLTAFWGGESIDPESGESHLLHVAWHMFAMYTWSQDPDLAAKFDDRAGTPVLEGQGPR